MSMRTILFCTAIVVFALGCQRDQRRFTEIAPSSGLNSQAPQMGAIQPGGKAAEENPVKTPYQDNAWAVSEGQRLFAQYNCAGCHSLGGGGGMGPPLMDNRWIYGSEPENIHQTIVEGRPNGMPSFRGKIPDQQVWELVAYVRSMSGMARQDVAAGREDHLPPHQPDQMMPPQSPVGQPHEQQGTGEKVEPPEKAQEQQGVGEKIDQAEKARSPK